MTSTHRRRWQAAKQGHTSGHGPHIDAETEIRDIKAVTHCATVLEHQVPPWRLDRRASSRQALKYRRGEGEIIIVNHDGRGWWDPGNAQAKGDVFGLIQYLQPWLNFGQARLFLRRLTGMRPTRLEQIHARRQPRTPLPVDGVWQSRPTMIPGSTAWDYLTADRALPPAILEHAARLDVIRAGPHGSAWFAHTDHAGRLTGIEMRGPHWRGFSAAGRKTLFRLPIGEPCARLVVLEAPINALSLAALEGAPSGSLYVATAGGMGPGTLEALEQLLDSIGGEPASVLVAATDADRAGDRYAEALANIACGKRVVTHRLRPPHQGDDWNDVLCRVRSRETSR